MSMKKSIDKALCGGSEVYRALGEAQKALVQVIPKELAEIKAAITKSDARYFDAATGTYMDRKQIRRNTRTRFQSAIENPFANIFNKLSEAPEDLRDKALWGNMQAEVQDQISKIVPFFTPGTPVSVPRTDVEYVVTEYGIAKLCGASIQEKAHALIQIAHPKFRDELTEEARKMNIF